MSSLTKGTVKVDIRRDSASDFDESNPLLKAGEPGFETDTYRLKIGDGTSLWRVLPYINSGHDETDRVGMGTSSPSANLQITQGTSGAGTVTITSNTTCTGTGTQFLNTFKVGDSIILTEESETRAITAIASNTVMTIASATNTTGSAYTLAGGNIASFKGNQYIGFGTTAPETRLHIASALTSTPVLTIENTTNDQTGSHLKFLKDKGAAGAAGDVLGSIDFYGDDTGQVETQFASIHAEVDVATNGQESGELVLKVASHDGGLENALIATGGSVDAEVDVTIGAGAASMTTIAGDLDIDGDKITSAGALEIETGGSGDLTLDVAGNIILDADGGTVTIADTTPSDLSPTLKLASTGAGAFGPFLNFVHTSESPAALDYLGYVAFGGKNSNGDDKNYITFVPQIYDEVDGSEDGRLIINVLAHDAGRPGLVLRGDSDGDVYVGLGYGTGSRTTIAGDLIINGDTITTAGAISLDSGGAITLDAHDGNFIAKKAGTEFSAINSAYAGMILGATYIAPSSIDRWTFTTSWESVTSGGSASYAPKVSFVFPPSGNVMITCEIGSNCSGLSGSLYMGLATDASATTLHSKYEHIVLDVDETDTVNPQHSWMISGTAGDAEEIWIMCKIVSGTGRINFGGASGAIQVQAIALPATVYDGT